VTEELYYYTWFTDRWQLSQARVEMNLAERGLYRELLDYFYTNGSLPADEATLARIVGAQAAEFRRAWRKVSGWFAPDDTGRLVSAAGTDLRNGLLRELNQRRAASQRGGEVTRDRHRGGPGEGRAARPGDRPRPGPGGGPAAWPIPGPDREPRAGPEARPVGGPAGGPTEDLRLKTKKENLTASADAAGFRGRAGLTALQKHTANEQGAAAANPPEEIATKTPENTTILPEIRELVDALHARHIEPGNPAKAYGEAQAAFAQSGDTWPAFSAMIGRHFLEWSEFWQRKRERDSEAFVPQLWRWFHSAEYIGKPSDEAQHSRKRASKTEFLDRIAKGEIDVNGRPIEVHR